jgi:hypothetical protein
MEDFRNAFEQFCNGNGKEFVYKDLLTIIITSGNNKYLHSHYFFLILKNNA